MDSSAEKEIATTSSTGITQDNAASAKIIFRTTFVGFETRLKRSNPSGSFFFLFLILSAIIFSPLLQLPNCPVLTSAENLLPRSAHVPAFLRCRLDDYCQIIALSRSIFLTMALAVRIVIHPATDCINAAAADIPVVEVRNCLYT